VKVQPTLWDAPPPPSGPQKDVTRFVGGSPAEAYAHWRHRTEDGRRVFAYVERIALDLAARGDERISVQRLIEEARAHLQLEVNHNLRSLLSDELIARHEHLIDLIERRRRKAA
jgi:hypothetical protein